MTGVIKASRLAGALVALAMVGGCTVLVTEPNRPTVDERQAGLKFDKALEYLDSARTNMKAARDRVDQLDQLTRGAVAVGVGGAAVSALSRGSSDSILGLLTVGGIGYSVNQTSQLPTQALIYNAGLNSLECVERTGSRIHRETGSAREQLKALQPRLQAAITAVAGDVENARAKATAAEGLSLVPQAESALSAARALQRSVAEFVSATDVGTEMYHAVNQTVFAVNGQLRSRAPSLDEIVKAGSTLTGFISSNARIRDDAEAARGATRGVNGAAATSQGRSGAEQLSQHLGDLHQVVTEVQKALPPPTTTVTFDGCQSLLPGQGVFRIAPSGPVKLVPGGDAYQFTVEADLLPLTFGFHGAMPSAQQLVVSHPGERVFSLAAPAGAKPDKYQFYVAQRDGRMLPDIEVAIVAGPATTKTTVKNEPQSRKAATGLSLEQKLPLLGLGPEVKSEQDVAFTNRVKKLDACFKLKPSTGVLMEDLVARLRAHTINSAGDCPPEKKQPDAQTQPAKPAAGSASVPIPAPPALAPASK